MALISIYADKDGRIAVRAPSQFKQALDGCPGVRYSKATRVWTYPWTPKALLSLKSALEEVWTVTALSPRITVLLETANTQSDRVSLIRASAEGLEPIALTGHLPPWDHQVQAFHFARTLPGCLFYMACGTGKSRVVIDLLQNEPDRRQNLIVASKKIVDNVWEGQFKTHWVREDGMHLLIQSGDTARLVERAQELAETGEPFTIVTTYQTVWRDPFARWALQQKWDQVTLDEIHRAKAPGGRASMFFARLSAITRFRLGLSGTPIPNGIQDSYGIYRFLDPGIFGTNFEKFGERYLEYGGFNNYEITGYKNEEEWNRKFYSIAFHVDDSVLKLPEPRFVTYTCEIGSAARKIYRELDKEFVARVGSGAISAKNILAKMVKLQQITSGYLQLDEVEGQTPVDTSKLDLIRDTLADIDVKEPVVVFYRFKPDAVALTKLLVESGRTVSEVSGRADGLKDWQAGKTSALIVQVAAGPEGIDLTRTKYGFFYSMSFGYGDWVQLIKRIVRPGQQWSATFFRLAVKGTIDEDLWNAIDHKCDLIDWVLHRVNGTSLPEGEHRAPPRRRPRKRTLPSE